MQPILHIHVLQIFSSALWLVFLHHVLFTFWFLSFLICKRGVVIASHRVILKFISIRIQCFKQHDFGILNSKIFYTG